MDNEDIKKRNLPDEYDGYLDCSSLAICCSFNRQGSLLAVGCNDGRVVLWDFLTRGVAKNIPAHAGHPVTSISWSRDGNELVSASLDNSLAIWKVLTGECKVRWIFKAPLMKVQFNPRNNRLIIACPYRHQPILLNVDYEEGDIEHKIIHTDKDDADATIAASFDRRGKYIYVGGAKGRLTIFRCPSLFDFSSPLDVISSFKIQPLGTTPPAIREIEFAAKNKNYFLVNSSDRAIRLYNCDNALQVGKNGSCEEIRRFQDLVSKQMWKRCCFSCDKDASYVCGGSANARQHAIYIWDTEEGTVKKMLQGGCSKGEMLLDIQWHPSKPVVASVSSGRVLVWARAEIENWSAYAPEFKELEENQEYSERESEFDIEDEDEYKKVKIKEEVESEEDDNIDIVNVPYEEGEYRSSDDEEVHKPKALQFIPISLEDYEMIEAQNQ